MPNLEIKARCKNFRLALERGQQFCRSLAAVEQQLDTYFLTRRGRLKLREPDASGALLIPYVRDESEGTLTTTFRVIPVDDSASLRALLTTILGVRTTVNKERHLFVWEGAKIHLDRVSNLGDFIEFEVPIETDAESDAQNKLNFLRSVFGVLDDDIVNGSYESMLGDSPPEHSSPES